MTRPYENRDCLSTVLYVTIQPSFLYICHLLKYIICFQNTVTTCYCLGTQDFNMKASEMKRDCRWRRGNNSTTFDDSTHYVSLFSGNDTQLVTGMSVLLNVFDTWSFLSVLKMILVGHVIRLLLVTRFWLTNMNAYDLGNQRCIIVFFVTMIKIIQFQTRQVKLLRVWTK